MIAAIMIGGGLAAVAFTVFEAPLGGFDVLVPANAPRFAIGIVVPSGPVQGGAVGGGAWPTGDGPMPAILKVLKDPTITRSFTEGLLAGEPTADGLRLGTVLVTRTTFDSIEDLPVAMREAAASLRRAPSTETPRAPTPATQAAAPREPYRHLLVIVDRWTRDEATLAAIRAARDEVIGRAAMGSGSSHPILPTGAHSQAALGPRVNQINAVAMNYNDAPGPSPLYVERAEVRDAIADSEVQINFPSGIDGEKHLGFAGEVSVFASGGQTPWLQSYVGGFVPNADLVDLLQRMFARMTVCPSDYDRDGASEPSQSDPTADYKQFLDAYVVQSIYADWNFDGQFTGSGTGFADGVKFYYGMPGNPGTLPLADCPNN